MALGTISLTRGRCLTITRDWRAVCKGSIVRNLLDRYRTIVKRCDALARANLAQIHGVAQFAVRAGVERRTLLRAFRAVHNTTPANYLRTLRLTALREALLSAAGADTVTEIAMRFGVRELGRFAVEYRAAFGESPSETLARRRELNCQQ